MRPSDPTLSGVLNELGGPRGGNIDPVSRARAENFLMEERVHPDRLAGYESRHPPREATRDAWTRSHNDYLQASVFVDVPETFGSLNSDAALPPAVSSTLGREQVLIRVECLDFALNETKICSLVDLEHNLAVYTGSRKDALTSQGDAKALLEEVCRSLNTNPYAVRPRFAAFAEEMQEEIESADWADRLRDRLGLAHYPSPKIKFGAHPVALMRYKVGEVTDQASHAGTTFALTVPTALDAEPYEIFHPAPKESNFGRTLNLAGCGDECDRLASEVLHLRVDYKPSHILKVGAVTTPVDTSPSRIAEMREQHLFCLRYLHGNEDFGTL
ncbi:hypothetical protein [Skermanella pratensis]|uniref:hypothetical protein n=1 Tax=Skermanella pratensis TaxID=2233999 RepID=UPI001301869C|nr:hypothetical protein [Skermanella pratensis]